MKKGFYIFILALCSLAASAQDIHWSQPANVLLYLNPAFTAIEGQYSAGLNFKDQWSAAGKAYRTYMVGGDVRLMNARSLQFGLGGIINREVAGDGGYKTISAGLTLSTIIKAGKRCRIGAGYGATFVQNSLSDDGYSWGTQFDGENYNPYLHPGENLFIGTHKYFDMNAGVSFIYDDETGSLAKSSVHRKWMLGYSINHITSPVISFTGSNDKLSIKHTGYVRGQIPIGEKYSIVPIGVFYLQGKKMEITGGAMLRRTIGQESKITGYKKAASAAVGLLFRTNSGFIPAVEVEKGNYVFAVSYDINTFNFSTATLRGGLEFSIRIRSTKKDAAAPPKKHGRPKHGGKWF